MPPLIEIRRVYELPQIKKGEYPYLVDRLWPRGFSKEQLSKVIWLKEAAPSPALRRWYGHDPSKFGEFKRRYLAELDSEEKEEMLRKAFKGRRRVVLLTATKDLEHSAAAVLKGKIESLLRG